MISRLLCSYWLVRQGGKGVVVYKLQMVMSSIRLAMCREGMAHICEARSAGTSSKYPLQSLRINPMHIHWAANINKKEVMMAGRQVTTLP